MALRTSPRAPVLLGPSTSSLVLGSPPHKRIIPSLLGLAAAMSLEAQTVYGILEPKLEACASVLILHQPDRMLSALGVPSLLHGSS